MIRRILPTAGLLIIMAVSGVVLADTIREHYAAEALRNMAADIYSIEQEVRDFMGEAFQKSERETYRSDKVSRQHFALTHEQRTAIRARIDNMKKAGAAREEIRVAVLGMLKAYGVGSHNGQPSGFHHPQSHGQDPQREWRIPKANLS